MLFRFPWTRKKQTEALSCLRATAGAPQTLGAALRGLLPQLFPSSRDPVLANVMLHGAHVPFTAPLEDLMREASYPDGWLCLVVVPLDM
jgi:autophagy-related protein 5